MHQKSIKVPPRSWASIDSLAIKVRYRLGLPTSGNLSSEQISTLFDNGSLNKIGILDYGVENLPFGDEGKYSPATSSLVLSLETYEGLHKGNKRSNFTLFHEIGHVILHGQYINNATSARTPLKQFHRNTIPAYLDPECQANQFAAAILMPHNDIKKDLKNGLTIEDISNKYNVSYSAASNRINYVRKNY